MTFDEVVALAFWVGTVMVAGVAVFVVVPRLVRSLLRYSLWSLRDRIVDDVFDGRLDADDPGVRRLLAMTEGVIVAASGMTLLGLLLADVTIFRDVVPPALPSDVTMLDPPGRQLLAERENALWRTTTRLVLLGSPSGWLAASVAPVAMLAGVAPPFRRHILAAPAVAPGDRSSLGAYV